MLSLEEDRLENAKIIDLGLAKVVAEEDTLSTRGKFYRNTELRQPGTVCRTWDGHSFRSVFIGDNALGDAFR